MATIKTYCTVLSIFYSSPVSALRFPLNDLQIRAVLVLWFRWLCPGGLWESVKAVGRKGDDCCVTEDINQSGWTGQLSLLTHRHSLSNVAVVPFELSLDRPVETTENVTSPPISSTASLPYSCIVQTCPSCR